MRVQLVVICSILASFFYFGNLEAQCTGCCVDSTFIIGTANCNPLDYEPQCGCNGKTYRNQCYRLGAGVQSELHSGPCEPMDYFIYPTLITDNDGGLKLTIAVQYTTDVQIFITDVFAKTYYFRIIPYIDPNYNFQMSIPVDNLRIGIYFMVIKTASGYYKLTRFEKQGIP